MRDREFASLFFSSQTSLLPEMLFASTCISLANSAGCGIGCLAFIESNLGDSVGGSVNSQKLERMYVAALSRIEAAEPGAETTKSTPIFCAIPMPARSVLSTMRQMPWAICGCAKVHGSMVQSRFRQLLTLKSTRTDLCRRHPKSL